MSKSKKALINTALVALIMIVYQLLPNNFDLSFLPTETAVVAVKFLSVLQYILSIIYNLILYSVLILIWSKNKYLLEKPLFDKSLPFAKRFNLNKLVLAFVVSVLSYLLNYVTAVISLVICPDFNLWIALSGVYMSLFWLVLYFVITGKGHNILKSPKYAVFSFAVILLATVVRTIVDIGYITMMNVQSGNILDYAMLLDYSTRVGYVDVLSSFAVACALVFFHVLSAPEEVPLETSDKAEKVTE